MKNQVTFTLTVDQRGRKDKVFSNIVTYEYSDKNYVKIENMIRDICTGLANKFIEAEYYT